MTMRFPFRYPRRNHPSVPLGGTILQPRPLISVTLIGPRGTWVAEGLLDTGADETIFSETLAPMLGIDLTNAPSGNLAAAGQTGYSVRYAILTLRIADLHERRQWDGLVGFSSARLRRPLLGFASFLQYFTSAFHGDREFVELTVNNLYPGT